MERRTNIENRERNCIDWGETLFFFSNQPDALIIHIYSVLYIRHW